MGAKLPDVIKTARLVLRPFAFDDVHDVLAYAVDPEWSRYLPVPRPYTEADAYRFIAAQVLLDHHEHPVWAIEHTGIGIGGINLRYSEGARIAEVGFSIARNYWGQGLATEATSAVVDAAFAADPRLVRVRAMADARNVASIRVVEKCGFAREGTLRSNRFIHDEPIDEVWCGLLRSEWAARARDRAR
jgi:RimJ/RimL family protein N-acetyltransferase